MAYSTITPQVLENSRNNGLHDDSILDNYMKDPNADPSVIQSYKRVRDSGHRYQYDDGGEIPLSTATLNYAAYKDIRAWQPPKKMDTREIPWEEEGAFQNVHNVLEDRSGKMAEAMRKGVTGEITLPESALQTVGHGAAAVPEVVFGAVKGISKTPLHILDRITLGFPKAIAGYLGKTVLNDPNVQDLLSAAQAGFEKYREFKEKYPRVAADLEAGANIASLGLSAWPGVKIAEKTLPTIRGVLPETKGILPALKGTLRGSTREAPDIIERIVQPIRSTKELQALYEKSPSLFPTGRKIIGKTAPALTDSEKALADYLRNSVPELSMITKPLEAGPVLIKRIQTIGATLDKSIEESKAILSIKESVGKMRSGVSAARESFGESAGIFKAEMERFAKWRGKFPGTLKGEREALKAYDKDTAFRFGKSIYEKGTARAEAVRAVRETSHGTLSSAAARVGIDTTSSIGEMRQLYQVLESLSTQVRPEIFDSWLKKISSSALGKAAATSVGVGSVLKIVP